MQSFRITCRLFENGRMKLKTDREKYFRTSSLPLAVFLYTKGQQIAGLNPTDSPGKKEFAFAASVRLDELADKYKFGYRNDPDLLVQVRVYEHARNELLDRINE